MNVKGALQILAVAAFLFSGCSREEPVDPNRPIKIDNFVMGTALGPNGGIAYGAVEGAGAAFDDAARDELARAAAAHRFGGFERQAIALGETGE